MGEINDKFKNISENENVQKAKNAASNAGKKIGDGLSNAAESVKGSAAYAKAMDNKHVQKAAKFLGRFDKKVQIIIIVVALVLVLAIVGFILSAILGAGDIVLKDGETKDVPDGKATIHIKGDTATIGFDGIDQTMNYLIEAEDGHKDEQGGMYAETFEDEEYDIELESKDTDGDGYVEFEIKKMTEDLDFETICIVKAKLEK